MQFVSVISKQERMMPLSTLCNLVLGQNPVSRINLCFSIGGKRVIARKVVFRPDVSFMNI